MTVVDSSVLVAVVLGEDDAGSYTASLRSTPVSVSTVSVVESCMVVEARQGPEAGRDLAELMRELAVAVVPVDQRQADLAIRAWRRFGKGRHPASLNLGDCFSYALAEALGEPLLFKGDDFTQTDIRSAQR